LSSWRAVINCSEPVYHQSQTVFLEKFTPYGLQEEALSVSYAMAENTFAVTQSAMGSPPPIDWVAVSALQEQGQAVPTQEGSYGAVSMVSCGMPIRGTEVVVLDAHGEVLAERYVGEVALRSNCMLAGYYRRPDITAEAIQDGWYRTGDMGYLADGHLYITGRKKDLIIVGGKNVYPQDLEAIANHIPGIYPGRAVAFGLYIEQVGSETVVLVAELLEPATEEARRKIELELRRQVAQETEITLADVRLVEKRWLIKTSSGKIARNDNRQKYLNEFRPEAVTA
jgi:fatty-acyl-CoA synthase